MLGGYSKPEGVLVNNVILQCSERLIECVGPGLESGKQLEDFDAVAADFVKLKGLVYRSCKQCEHFARMPAARSLENGP